MCWLLPWLRLLLLSLPWGLCRRSRESRLRDHRLRGSHLRRILRRVPRLRDYRLRGSHLRRILWRVSRLRDHWLRAVACG
jgi:hypothetical protein